MQKITLILLLLCFVSSCKSSKRVSDNSIKTAGTTTENLSANSLADIIIKNAKAFDGVCYKYGGTTNKGMDCSGLIYISFKTEHIILPRISRDMAKKGIQIKLNEVKKGDLLFFQTKKNRNVINHVGLVTNSINGSIDFIHSTTSNGVITSSLEEPYWHSSFIEARRIL